MLGYVYNVCMYVRVYVYIYMYIYACMYVNVYCRVFSIGRGIQRCMYVCIHVCIYVCMYVRTCTLCSRPKCMYLCMYVHMSVIISKEMLLLVHISTMIVYSYYSGGCKLANGIGIMVFLVALFTFFAIFESKASADKLGRYAALGEGEEGGGGGGQGH
jgi:hypothetical protein